jgi:hypothetical protein
MYELVVCVNIKWLLHDGILQKKNLQIIYDKKNLKQVYYFVPNM